MKNDKTKSGWLSWRFWLGSAVFWLLFGGLSLSASLLQTGELSPPEAPGLLRLLGERMAPYWLATPLMFELAFRLGRTKLPAKLHWALLLAAVMVAAVLHTALFWVSYGWPAAAWDVTWWFVAMWLPMAIHYVAILGCGVAINQYRLNEERRRELLAAQLRVLRGQLQPHFLFNTLQAIASTARRSADEAVRMLALLGDMLRQTLREREGDLVPLAEEQQLLEPYLELQRLRFADRLRIEVDLPDEVLGALVPDLLLQPLVENALRHGVEQKPGAGTVEIRARRRGDTLELQVADDGPGPGSDATADGVGLGATRARLRALFGEAAEVDLVAGAGHGTVVSVRLPWREARRAA